MRVINNFSNLGTLYEAYQAVMSAPPSRPRGELIYDLRGVALIFDLNEPVLTSFVHRNLNLTYCKREWLWYIGADPYDDSISQWAKMWAKLQQPDGRFFSNYGHYIFGGRPSQFDYVLNQLQDDPDSRRASMVLLERGHLFKENVDTVCTYAINFAIVSGQLNMTVHMRSNDVVFGLTNDAFCFSQLAEFVYQGLAATNPHLKRGQYVHIADSLHVYRRHLDRLEQILKDPTTTSRIDVPRPSWLEVCELIDSGGQRGRGEYSEWLKTVD